MPLTEIEKYQIAFRIQNCESYESLHNWEMDLEFLQSCLKKRNKEWRRLHPILKEEPGAPPHA